MPGIPGLIHKIQKALFFLAEFPRIQTGDWKELRVRELKSEIRGNIPASLLVYGECLGFSCEYNRLVLGIPLPVYFLYIQGRISHSKVVWYFILKVPLLWQPEGETHKYSKAFSTIHLTSLPPRPHTSSSHVLPILPSFTLAPPLPLPSYPFLPLWYFHPNTPGELTSVTRAVGV